MASTGSDGRLPEHISDDDVELDSTPSPQKRSKVQAPPDTPLTLGLLTQLLEQNLAKQTRELREAQKLEMSRAVSQLEAKQSEIVRGINDKLEHQGRDVAVLRQGHAELEKRLDKLEAGGSTAAGSSMGDNRRQNAIVFGGWPQSTRKPAMIEDLDRALQSLRIKGCLDQPVVAPGVRKGICVAQISTRDAENSQDVRERMIKVVSAVSEAAVTTTHMEPGKCLWAAISRPRHERQRAAHAGKIRKLLHTIGKNLISRTDTEYPTGSLWLDEDLLGSSVKPRPADGSAVADGLVAGSWVDVGKIARVAKLTERQVHDMWQQAIAGN